VRVGYRRRVKVSDLRGAWPPAATPSTPDNGVLAEGPLPVARSVEYLAGRLAAVPGVVAVTLGDRGRTSARWAGRGGPAGPGQTLSTWFRLAAGSLSFADVSAGRQDRVACLASLCQAVLATGQGRLAAGACGC
jgi:hypothetical protein